MGKSNQFWLIQSVLAEKQRRCQQRFQAHGKALRWGFICFLHSKQRGPLWVIRQETRGLESPSRTKGPKTGSEEQHTSTSSAWGAKVKWPQGWASQFWSNFLGLEPEGQMPSACEHAGFKADCCPWEPSVLFSSVLEEFYIINCVFWEANLWPAGSWTQNPCYGKRDLTQW